MVILSPTLRHIQHYSSCFFSTRPWFLGSFGQQMGFCDVACFLSSVKYFVDFNFTTALVFYVPFLGFWEANLRAANILK